MNIPQWMLDLPVLGQVFLKWQARCQPQYAKALAVSLRPSFRAALTHLQLVLTKYEPNNGPYEIHTRVERHHTRDGEVMVIAVWVQGQATLRYGKTFFPIHDPGKVWEPIFERVWNEKKGVFEEVCTPVAYDSVTTWNARLAQRAAFYEQARQADPDATVPELF